MSIQADDPPTLTTRVGQAIWGDNLFRGHSVTHDLAGRETFWSVLSLAVGGPHLSAADARVLDDVTVCCLAADPRIWPLKAARVAASYGSELTGVAVGMLAADGAHVGPKIIEKTATFLIALADELPVDASPTQVSELLDRWMDERRRIFGFGVPFRDSDERVDALRTCLKLRGRTEGRFWRLIESVGNHLGPNHGLPTNIGAGCCAAMLDLGLSPDQISAIQWMFFYPCFWANASEGARQRAPILQRLPESSVRYAGAAPRSSPRLLAAAESPRDE